MYKAINTLNNNKLHPLWITGITDSQGNLSINYNTKSNKVSASYKVTQKEHSLVILLDLKESFDCGTLNIDNRKTDGYKYIVNKNSDLLNIIIPHFEKYPLVGSKHLDFLDFKRCVLLISDNHLSNMDSILSIKKGMNRNRLYDDRWNYLKNKVFNLEPQWVQAFIEGEGSFQCRIANAVSRGNKYICVNPTL